MNKNDFILPLSCVNNNSVSVHFADFESVVVDSVHYVCCFSIFDASKNSSLVQCISINEDDQLINQSNLLVAEFFRSCFQFLCFERSNKCIVYFHNFGKFDSIFLINQFLEQTTHVDYKPQIIMRNNIVYQITICFNGKTIQFRDCFLLYPYSLNKWAHDFNVKSKIEFDFNELNVQNLKKYDFLSQLKTYCKNDTLILKECFFLYKDFIEKHFSISITSTLTLSSLAFKIFRTHFYQPNHFSQMILKSDFFQDSFIRRSYKGGVVDVYKPKANKPAFFYDVNSLYPFIMMEYEFPTGNCTFHNNLAGYDIESFGSNLGFFEAEIESPNNLYIPFLTYTDKKRGLISPEGKWTSVFFSEELKYAKSLGYRIFLKNGYIFQNKSRIFHNYVKNIYDLRVKYKEDNLSIIFKYLLNTLYGRFGMNNEQKIIEIVDSDDKDKIAELDLFFNGIVQDFGKKTIITHNNTLDLLSVQKFYSDQNIYKIYNSYMEKNKANFKKLNIAVHIASATTAYARIYMHKLKVQFQNDLVYSDTDSLVLNNPIQNQDLLCQYTIGKLKLEGVIENSLFLAPKFYFVEFKDSNSTTIKIKGVPQHSFKKEFFYSLYEEQKIPSLTIQNNFIRDFTRFFIKTDNYNVNISGSFLKREKIFDKNNKWVDTKPLKIF